MMDFFVYSFQPIDSRMYIAIEGKHALVIDPCVDEEAYKTLEERNVSEVLIILTHEHYDHISGVNAFKERFDCQVICSEKCGKKIEDEKCNLSKYYDVLFLMEHNNPTQRTEPYQCSATQVFQEKWCFQWEGHEICLTETPGHSEGCICIEVDDQYLFTGDSLLKNNDVIMKMKSSSKEEYEKVTKSFLLGIKQDVYVYPGHGESGYMREFCVK